MRKMLLILLPVILSVFTLPVYGEDPKCSGSFLNPITDICWKCMFPIYVPIGYTFQNQKGKTIVNDPEARAGPNLLLGLGTCMCQSRGYVMPPGILLSYQEPIRSVDVTKDPFCMVSLGGVNLGGALGSIFPAGGYGEEVRGLQTKSSFYQAHWYANPILSLLELLDNTCTMGLQSDMDILFMSEIDPMWNDDDTAFIFSPEAVLFSSFPAQLACAADCLSNSIPAHDESVYPSLGFYDPIKNPANPGSRTNPSRYLYWCGGCQGSLFPLTGTNIDSTHAVQSSILTSEKLNTLMHRMSLEPITTGNIGMCSNIVPDLFPDKSEWKYSMTFPKIQAKNPGNCCNSFGETDSTWNTMATYPIKGENFSYLWFHERDCCAF